MSLIDPTDLELDAFTTATTERIRYTGSVRADFKKLWEMLNDLYGTGSWAKAAVFKEFTHINGQERWQYLAPDRGIYIGQPVTKLIPEGLWEPASAPVRGDPFAVVWCHGQQKVLCYLSESPESIATVQCWTGGRMDMATAIVADQTHQIQLKVVLLCLMKCLGLNSDEYDLMWEQIVEEMRMEPMFGTEFNFEA